VQTASGNLLNDDELTVSENITLGMHNDGFSAFSDSVVYYVTGALISSINDKKLCNTCKALLLSTELSHIDVSTLVDLRTFGGLVYPSTSVFSFISDMDLAADNFLRSAFQRRELTGALRRHLADCVAVPHDILLSCCKVHAALIRKFVSLKLNAFAANLTRNMCV
jgi:hypothetical protein